MILSVGFIAAALVATSALAHPLFPATVSRHATHRARAVVDGVTTNAFHPPNTFETFGDGLGHSSRKRQEGGSTQEIASEFIQSRLGVAASAIHANKAFDNEVGGFAFFKQKLNGITVANAVANVVINKDDKITAFGNNFVKPKSISSSTPKLTVSQAISKAESQLAATHNGIEPFLEFFAKEDGSAVLTFVVQVENNNHFFEAFVDASNGAIVSANDFLTQEDFNVVDFQVQSPDNGFTFEVNPELLASSPQGWVANGTTAGNNAISFKAAQTATAVETSPGVFNYTFDPTLDPTDPSNLAIAKVNAFYDVNTVHDITYQYGFTEASFNFQNDNFGLGGAQNDRVTISVQDAAGINNADFSTPPDGQSGRMRMFLWNHSTPDRDGALESDIVFHEATHGTSNRLTGGGTGRCLQTTEAGGMGEGWSDTFADWAEQNSAPIQDTALGVYVILKPGGIRTQVYSTSPQVNNLTYADLQVRTEVHAIGEVWANLLHNVHAALVDVHGFAEEAKFDATRTEGNAVFMHLFIDGLATQPCNPTFLTARNAWIQADATRFNGENRCTLWTAFASRGLGLNAAGHVNNFDVPADC